MFCLIFDDGIGVRCFLKYLEQIFQLTLISVEGSVNAFNDGDGIWWLSKLQATHLSLLTLDGEIW